MFSSWTCYIVQNQQVTQMVIVSQFLQLEGQSERYMNTRKQERNTHRDHRGIVLEPRRTWGNGDMASVIMRLVPTMFCKALQRSYSQ